MMRSRQKQRPDLYPKWRNKEDSPARQAKRRDNNQCIICGIEDRTIIFDDQGNPRYMLYLHAAHLCDLDPMYWETEPIEGQRLRAMCPRHHRQYDLHWAPRIEEAEHQRALLKAAREQDQEPGFIMQRFTIVI
jgi:hypothetical protein